MRHPLPPLAALAFLAAAPALAQDCPEGQWSYAHHAGETCVPEAPQRIVSLHDLTITLTLVEMGLTDRIAGSMGRLYDGMAAPSLGTVPQLMGVDFDTGGIAFVGMGEYDLERIAALRPDLIIGRPDNADIHQQLSSLAPTVLLSPEMPFIDYMRDIARLGGASERFEELKAAYDERVERLREAIPDASAIDLAILHAEPGWIALYDDFYALSQAADDLGLDQPEPVEALFADAEGVYDHATRREIGAEALPVAEADLLFMPYYFDAEGRASVEEVEASMEEILPGWCGFLEVCRAGQVVPFEATAIYAASFASLDAALTLLEAQIVGKTITQVVE